MEAPDQLAQRASSIIATLERLQADYGVETMLVITRGNINADRFTKAHTSQKCASFLKSIVRTDANRLAEQIEGYVISGAANQATVKPPVPENMKQKEKIRVARTIIMNGLVEILRANGIPEDQIPKSMNYRNYQSKRVNQYGVVLVGFPGSKGVMNPGFLDAASLKELLARLKDGRCYWKKADQPDHPPWSPSSTTGSPSASPAGTPQFVGSPGATPPSSTASSTGSYPEEESLDPSLFSDDDDDAILDETSPEPADGDVRPVTTELDIESPASSLGNLPLNRAFAEDRHASTSASSSPSSSATSPSVSATMAATNPQDASRFPFSNSGLFEAPTLGIPPPPSDFGSLLHQLQSSPNSYGFTSSPAPPPVGFSQNLNSPMGFNMQADPAARMRMYMTAMQLLWASNSGMGYNSGWSSQGMLPPLDMSGIPFPFNSGMNGLLDIPMMANESPIMPPGINHPFHSPMASFVPPMPTEPLHAGNPSLHSGLFDKHMFSEPTAVVNDSASPIPSQAPQSVGSPNVDMEAAATHLRADQDLNMDTTSLELEELLGNFENSTSH